MCEDESIRFIFDDDNMSYHFIYRPPQGINYISETCTSGVKFSQQRIILDDWHLIGGTKWSRTIYRLKHPIVYGKRGLRNLYRCIKRIFIKDCCVPYIQESWNINLKSLKKHREEKNGNNQKQESPSHHDQTNIGKQSL